MSPDGEFGLGPAPTGPRSRPSTPEAFPSHGRGRVGVCRSGNPVRRHHQRLAHQPGEWADHRLQPVLSTCRSTTRRATWRRSTWMKFLGTDGTFQTERFVKAVELIITAMDISICFADFPTEAIGRTTSGLPPARHRVRQSGCLADGVGLAYDSDGGRAMAASITSLMTGVLPAQRRDRGGRGSVPGVRAQQRGASSGHAQACVGH